MPKLDVQTGNILTVAVAAGADGVRSGHEFRRHAEDKRARKRRLRPRSAGWRRIRLCGSGANAETGEGMFVSAA